MRLLKIICCITALITNCVGNPVNDAFVTVSSEEVFPTTTLESSSIDDNDASSTASNKEVEKPELYSMKVYSNINTRYATNVVSSRVANIANKSQEVTFSIVIPETAFISEFLMEIDGKVYKAYVKKKDEAKQIYDQAVSSGIGAAHVSVSARDSNRFTVSVNVEAQKKALFNLTYEELLTRRLGVYNLVINLHPGQLVREMSVDVDILESQSITTLRTPVLRTGNEIDPDENTENNKYAMKEFTNDAKTMAHIRFSPTIDQQKQLIYDLKNKNEDKSTDEVNSGISGQFVVQYDVQRDLNGGSMVVYDGYFVHFFSPNGLTPLNKHVIFVLDVSGSMSGSKIVQLKRAMNYILDDLHPGDYFNLIEFSYSAHVYDLSTDSPPKAKPRYSSWFEKTDESDIEIKPGYAVNAQNIAKAKEVIDKLEAYGGTNIDIALKVALKMAQAGIGPNKEGPDPLIIFLTDGDPTVGETKTSNILKTVGELNQGSKYSSIFALAFGDDADRGFLKQLAVRNSGFMRHIYEAHDADIQLQQFYKQISSPLLKNITFTYPDNQVENLTDHYCHTLFDGSEFITAGKLINKDVIPQPTIIIPHKRNHTEFKSNIVQTTSLPSKPSLERLWAFLKIKQLLDKKDAFIDPDLGPTLFETTESPNTKLTKSSIETQALEIALKYSFVTKLTSLVVVKPNSTEDTTAETLPVPIPANKPYSSMALALSSSVYAHRPSYKSSLRSGYVGNPFTYRSFHHNLPRPIMQSGLLATNQVAVAQQYSIDRNDNIYLTTPFSYSTTEWISTTPPTTTENHTQLLKKYNLENFNWLNISDGFIEISGVTYNITDLPQNHSSFGECNNADDRKRGICVPVNKCQSSWTILINENKYEQYKCNGEYLGNTYFTMCCDSKMVLH